VEQKRIATASGRGETILLVEDEDAVRKLIRSALRNAGYTVLEARHGEEALELGRTHLGTIHLVITDVIMPHMSGRDLADRFAELRPEVKLLFMSGYTAEMAVEPKGPDSSRLFLQKPFTPAVLVAKVREILDSHVA